MLKINKNTEISIKGQPQKLLNYDHKWVIYFMGLQILNTEKKS